MHGCIGALMPHGMYGRRFLRHLALTGPEDISMPRRCFMTMNCHVSSRRHRAGARHDPLTNALSAFDQGNDDWLSALQYRDLNHYLPLDILPRSIA